MPSGTSTQYDVNPDFSQEQTSHAKILKLVPPGSRVLELGCASGYMTRVFKERGCQVVAVDHDAELAAKARPYCERLLVGELDSLDLTKEFEGEKFDVVVAADVLEHLREPWKTLEQARQLLKEGGYVAASLPSITHVSVALELLKGNFDYRPLGLIDDTHARFFSRRGLLHLFDRAGFWLSQIDRTYAAPHKMEVAQPLTEFNAELVEHVQKNDEAVTYQFIVRAVPASEHAQLERLREELETLRASQSHLEPAVAKAREHGLSAKVEELEDLLRRRSEAQARMAADMDRAEERAKRLELDLQAARAQVEVLRNGRGGALDIWNVLDTASAVVRGSLEMLQRVSPRLSPVNQLSPVENESGAYDSTGPDPHFKVERPFPTGWAEIVLRGSAEPPAKCVLYVDRGDGFSEAAAYCLGHLPSQTTERRVLVPLDGAKSLRLDPGTRPGRIRIEEFSLRRVSRPKVALRALQLHLERHPEHRRDYGWLAASCRGLLQPGSWRSLWTQAKSDVLQEFSADTGEYAAWIEMNRPGPAELASIRREVEDLTYRPTFSILVPIYNPEENWIHQCIGSVLRQQYPHWELCLADDASTKPHVRRVLEEYAAKDSRIKVVFRPKNGHISAATNTALELASGEFCALLDQDDEMTPDALFRNAQVLNLHPDTDLIYSDEDKIDERGNRHSPYFKPAWSPELLLSQMYVGHLGVYRREILTQIGGFREGYQGSQDFDVALRFTERTTRIRHIPRVLYHWRAVAGSAASSVEAKPYAYRAARASLEDSLKRRDLAGKVDVDERFPGHYIVRYQVDPAQRVSIVIPTRDRADLLQRCLSSLVELTEWQGFDVCVVDNGSVERATFELFQRWKRQLGPRFKVVTDEGQFNFARLINAGVAATKAPLLLLLNNDTEILHPSWLEDMMGYAVQPGIAAVGSRLLYADGTIQHAGVLLLGPELIAAHAHQDFPGDTPGYFGRAISSSNVSAVTAACLMVKRSVFEQLGGFDETLGVAYNDVDFCLRALERGHRNVCLGHVRLVHHESKSRGYEDSLEKKKRLQRESELMRERWGALLEADPYYNRNLRLDRTDFSIKPERISFDAPSDDLPAPTREVGPRTAEQIAPRVPTRAVRSVG